MLAGLAGFVSGLISQRYLRLTPTEISAPKYGWSRTNTVVRLAEITDIGIQSVQRQRLLNIYHRGGKLTITQSFLPDAAAFEELYTALVTRARTAGWPPALRALRFRFFFSVRFAWPQTGKKSQR